MDGSVWPFVCLYIVIHESVVLYILYVHLCT